MKLRVRIVSLTALIGSLLVAGCGGGGGGALPNVPAAQQPPTHGMASVALVIPASTTIASSARKRPAFVSPATLGATIATGTATTVVDLSPQSNACTTQGSSRVCTATVTVDYGPVTFTVTTYDTAPQNNGIPPGAHVLGTGTVTQTIVSGGGPVAIAIDAVVNGFGTLPSFVSMPADGKTHAFGFALNPRDFGNASISNGPTDPYANPISVRLVESGGSGHAHLVVNGAAGGTSATLTSSQNTIAVAYDGGGAPGYGISVAFSAAGVSPVTTNVSPLFVTSSSPSFSNGTLTLSGTSSNVTFTIAQANASGVTYSTQAVNCTNVASATQPATTSGVTSFVATGGTTASSSGCSIDVSDGVSTLAIAVVNAIAATATPSPTPSASSSPTATPTPTSAPTATPTPTPTPAPTPTPVPIGPSVFAASGTEMSTFPLAIGTGFQNIAPTTQLTPSMCCTGLQIPAYDAHTGYIWAPDNQHSVVDAFFPGSNGSSIVPEKQISTGTPASAVAVDSAGDLYLTASTFGQASIIIIPAGGTSIGTTITGTNTGLTLPRGIGVDSAGYIYVADENNATVSVFAPIAANAGTVNATPVRTFSTPTGSAPYGLALDGSGRIWVADPQSKQVLLYPAGTSNTASSTSLLSINGGGVVYLPYSVAVDANGNLWIGDTGQITEITASAITNALPLGYLQNPSAQIIGGATTLLGSQMITTH